LQDFFLIIDGIIVDDNKYMDKLIFTNKFFDEFHILIYQWILSSLRNSFVKSTKNIYR